MAAGVRHLSRERRSGTVNRVVLISDGLANTGMTDPRALGRIARRHRGESISLTSMGVGLSYNENLMMGLAESGGGNYYFIEHPEQLASIFRSEFQMMSRLYAHNSIIELRLHPSARMRDIIGSPYEMKGHTIAIPLGDLYYGEDREITLSVDVEGGRGDLMLASGALAIPAEGKRSAQSVSFSSSLAYTEDMKEVERKRDLDVQAKADILQSTKVVEEALQMFDAGDRDGAQRRLEEAKSALAASPAAAQGSGAMKEAIDDQLGRLDSYENEVKDEKGDAARTKKAIQYDNYRAQRKK
jgi:Ca-activated chloride channel family protein